MAHSKEPLQNVAEGFEGEVAGFELSDIIQVKAQNRFSGCIDVAYEERRGLVFLRDGEIIHAEQGDIVGEEAFYAILAWPGGRFSLQPNVATTRSTIRKGCQHLLLEAHRLIDERKVGRRNEPPPSPTAAPRPLPTVVLMEKVRAIPGVARAVLQGKDGSRIEDDGYEEEVLAGQALYLAMIGRQLGATFQAGEVHSAVVHGTKHHLLLFAAKSHLLCVLVDGEAQLGNVEAEVRKMLTRR